MTRINTNIPALRGLRNLGRSNQLLNTSLERLSTGLQINTGKDNPSGLIASETLRSQITVIEQTIKNNNRANNVIATADSALGEISGLLNGIRGLIQEGLNTGALSQSEIEANQLQIDSSLSAINRIASNTKFGSDKLLDGTKAFTTAISAADSAKLSDVQIDEALFGNNSSIAVNATVTSVAERGELIYAGGQLSSAATIEVGGTKGQEVLFLGSSATNANIRDAINNVTDSTGVTASIDDGVTFTRSATQSAVSIDVDAGATTNDDITFTRVDAGNDTDLGGSVSVEYIVSGNNTPLSINVQDDGSGNKTIQVHLETDGGGAAVTTANELVTAITNDTTASSLVTAAADGAGTGTLAAKAATALTGGLSEGKLVVSDVRTGGGALQVDVTDGGAGATATVTSFNGTNIAITIDDSATLDTIATAINNFAGLNNIVEATVVGDGNQIGLDGAGAGNTLSTDGGQLRLRSDSFGSSEFVSVNAVSGSFDTYDTSGTATNRDAGVDIGVTINGQAAVGKGLQASIRSATLNASLTFAAASNVATTNATVNITGGGSIFQVGQDVSIAGQVGLGIEAVTTARLGKESGKLYELGTGGGKSLLDVGPNVPGADLVKIIDEALDEVTQLRGRLGSLQKNVLETNITTFGVALENITDSRSQIIDTDFAAETSKLTRAQILSQSGLSVLAIANQAPSQVLNLLG